MEHLQKPRAALTNVFMQLRKACNHPLLFEAASAAEELAMERAAAAADRLEGSAPPAAPR